MKSMRTKLSAIASGVALGVASMAVTAADQPQLAATGPKSGAVFTGGATINGGASYMTTVPAADAVDLVATINPGSADVGQTGSLVAVLDVPGVGQFNLLSGGIWVPFDGSTILPFATKTLSASEPVEVLDGLIGADTNLTGLTLTAYVGYYTGGDVSNITYTSSGAQVTISPAPAPGCPAGTTSSSATFKGKPTCVIPGGTITEDLHLTANNSYLLDGQVVIGENGVDGAKTTSLTIDAGTYVYAVPGLNFLVIGRNGQIFANGSREKPIIFTHEGDDTATATTSSQWGGIVINGIASINEGAGEAEGEGNSGLYGGGANPNDADNSGSLTYVQVKYAGRIFTEDNELNGIAFQAVGSGTNVDYVQVHNNSDDGVEFFGGTVNAKHLLLTGNEDDSVDWTQGWRGKLQYVAVRMANGGDHCIEADNLDSNNDAEPRANPTILNMTCSGGQDQDEGQGVRLREGTSAFIANMVIDGFSSYCVDIDQDATFNNAGGSIAGLNGNLVMRNSLVASSCAFSASDGDIFSVAEWYAAQTASSQGAVDFGGTLGMTNGTAVNAVTPYNSTDSFFDEVDFIGAIKDDTSDWTQGWTFTPIQ